MTQDSLYQSLETITSLCESWKRGELTGNEFGKLYAAAMENINTDQITDNQTESRFYETIRTAGDVLEAIWNPSIDPPETSP